VPCGKLLHRSGVNALHVADVAIDLVEVDPINRKGCDLRHQPSGSLKIARKISNRLSLQLMPTFLHYNLVPLQTDPNNIIAIGFGVGNLILTAVILSLINHRSRDFNLKKQRRQIRLVDLPKGKPAVAPAAEL